MNTRPKLACVLFGHKVRPRPKLFNGHVWKYPWCPRCGRYPCRGKR